MNNITAIIVAGGQGTRLRPLTETIPKPMILLDGKPLLLHILNLFKSNGITHFVFALCYLPEVITEYFGDGSSFGVSIAYTFEDTDKPLGTAGAILAAQHHISSTCIVTYADVIRDLDIKAMLKAHKTSQSIATLHTYKHTGENYKSSLLFNEISSELQTFTELETSTKLSDGLSVWSNGSFYILEPEVFNYIQKDVATDFAKDVFPALLAQKKKISVFPTSSYFIDIGTLSTLAQAEKDIQKGVLRLPASL